MFFHFSVASDTLTIIPCLSEEEIINVWENAYADCEVVVTSKG